MEFNCEVSTKIKEEKVSDHFASLRRLVTKGKLCTGKPPNLNITRFRNAARMSGHEMEGKEGKQDRLLTAKRTDQRTPFNAQGT